MHKEYKDRYEVKTSRGSLVIMKSAKTGKFSREEIRKAILSVKETEKSIREPISSSRVRIKAG